MQQRAERARERRRLVRAGDDQPEVEPSSRSSASFSTAPPLRRSETSGAEKSTTGPSDGSPSSSAPRAGRPAGTARGRPRSGSTRSGSATAAGSRARAARSSATARRSSASSAGRPGSSTARAARSCRATAPGTRSRYGHEPQPCRQRSQSYEYATWPVNAHMSDSRHDRPPSATAAAAPWREVRAVRVVELHDVRVLEPRVADDAERRREEDVLEVEQVGDGARDAVARAPRDRALQRPDVAVGGRAPADEHARACPSARRPRAERGAAGAADPVGLAGCASDGAGPSRSTPCSTPCPPSPVGLDLCELDPPLSKGCVHGLDLNDVRRGRRRRGLECRWDANELPVPRPQPPPPISEPGETAPITGFEHLRARFGRLTSPSAHCSVLRRTPGPTLD